MGQKVNPTGFRIGITEEWRSRWFAPKAAFAEFLVEDHKIREYIDNKLNRQPPYAAVSKVEIERTRNEVKVVLHTARPGLVIGAKGAEVDKLKEALEDLIDRKINLNVVEVKVPDGDAKLIAEAISEQRRWRAAPKASRSCARVGWEGRRWPGERRRSAARSRSTRCRHMWTMVWPPAGQRTARSE